MAFNDKIKHVRDPKARMQVVWNYCKGKMTCEADDPKDEADENDEPKKGHGGCGAAQPLIRKEGLKLFVQYKRSKDDDEVRICVGRVSGANSFTGGEVTTARQAAVPPA